MSLSYKRYLKLDETEVFHRILFMVKLILKKLPFRYRRKICFMGMMGENEYYIQWVRYSRKDEDKDTICMVRFCKDTVKFMIEYNSDSKIDFSCNLDKWHYRNWIVDVCFHLKHTLDKILKKKIDFFC